MKVGIIADVLNDRPTGIGNYTYNLIKASNNINYFSLFLINHKPSPVSSNRSFIIHNPFPFFKTYGWYLFLAKKLKACNLDVIHNPTQIPTFFKFNKKYVLTVHDITPFLFPAEHRFGRNLIYNILFPRTLNNSDKIITDSVNTKNDLLTYFGIPESKIKVIYLAADDRFKPLNIDEIMKVKIKYSLNFPFILYVGTLEARKNIPVLIKAFYELKKKGINHKLVITGKRGWKYKNIFKTINQLNLHNDIFFTGYIENDDLPGLYNASDLFVYPSLYEGFGLPPLEAMSCGVPVITSNTSSLPEVVGDAGIMVDPLDIDKLAYSMYEVLTNSALKKDLSKKGLVRSKMFNWEKCVKETLEVYKECGKNISFSGESQ